MNDSDIVSMFVSRNEDAIRQAQRKYLKYLTVIAEGVLKNPEDAQLAVNDAFLAAWESIPPAKPASLSTYLGRLTKNRAVNMVKSNNAQKRGGGEVALVMEELAEVCANGSPGVEQVYENGELERAINGFLARLSRRHRDIFMMRYWYCMSVSDIASRLGTTSNTVSVTLSRARKKLKSYLQRKGYDV